MGRAIALVKVWAADRPMTQFRMTGAEVPLEEILRRSVDLTAAKGSTALPLSEIATSPAFIDVV